MGVCYVWVNHTKKEFLDPEAELNESGKRPYQLGTAHVLFLLFLNRHWGDGDIITVHADVDDAPWMEDNPDDPPYHKLRADWASVFDRYAWLQYDVGRFIR